MPSVTKTHRKIQVLLNDHQKELEKAMQQREDNGEEFQIFQEPEEDGFGNATSEG